MNVYFLFDAIFMHFSFRMSHFRPVSHICLGFEVFFGAQKMHALSEFEGSLVVATSTVLVVASNNDVAFDIEKIAKSADTIKQK